MMNQSLISHLALRFGTGPEAVANEVLAYILARSSAARAGLLNVCAIASPGVPHMLDIRSRPNDVAAATPALMGQEPGGTTRLVVVPKFWSGLGEHQPLDDLRLLTPDLTGALVVVAPASRFTTLWADLRRRCRLAGIPVHGDHAAGDPIRWTQVGPKQVLILVSWSALLAGIQSSLATPGEQPLLRELDHLASLCDQMSSDTFLPLTADELTAAAPRRLVQLLDLLDDLAAACEQRGIGRSTPDNAAARAGTYRRVLRSGQIDFGLIWSLPLWATQRETPFWLRIAGRGRLRANTLAEQLQVLANEVPPRLLRDPNDDQPLVPLFPLIGVERAEVLSDLVRQVTEVARLLDRADDVPTEGFGSPRGRSE